MSAILPSAVDCCETEFCTAPITVSVPGPAGSIGPAGPPGASGLLGLLVADNLAVARALPNLATNRFLIMLGGAVIGDSFGAFFFWDNTSVALDNYSATGGSVITPDGSSGPGRWIRF